METLGPKNTELAYLAGLFDGEGNVGITERIHKERSNDRVHFIPSINIINTDPNIPRDFAKLFGGKVTKRVRTQEGHRDIYRWECKSAKALMKIIPLLMKYTRSKTMQLIQLKLLCDRMTGSTTPLTEGEIRYRRKLKENISRMNHQSYEVRSSEPVLMSEV